MRHVSRLEGKVGRHRESRSVSVFPTDGAHASFYCEQHLRHFRLVREISRIFRLIPTLNGLPPHPDFSGKNSREYLTAINLWKCVSVKLFPNFFPDLAIRQFSEDAPVGKYVKRTCGRRLLQIARYYDGGPSFRQPFFLLNFMY